jgi:hypothetical protein
LGINGSSAAMRGDVIRWTIGLKSILQANLATFRPKQELTILPTDIWAELCQEKALESFSRPWRRLSDSTVVPGASQLPGNRKRKHALACMPNACSGPIRSSLNPPEKDKILSEAGVNLSSRNLPDAKRSICVGRVPRTRVHKPGAKALDKLSLECLDVTSLLAHPIAHWCRALSTIYCCLPLTSAAFLFSSVCLPDFQP